jgi:hypothetical protein
MERVTLARWEITEPSRWRVTLTIGADIELLADAGWGNNSSAGLGRGTARGRTVKGHTPPGVNRLLIRPASGRQTGAGLFARTHHSQDTRPPHIRERDVRKIAASDPTQQALRIHRVTLATSADGSEPSRSAPLSGVI